MYQQLTEGCSDDTYSNFKKEGKIKINNIIARHISDYKEALKKYVEDMRGWILL